MTTLNLLLMALLAMSVILNVVQGLRAYHTERQFDELVDAANEALDLLAEARMYVANEQEAAKEAVKQ